MTPKDYIMCLEGGSGAEVPALGCHLSGPVHERRPLRSTASESRHFQSAMQRGLLWSIFV